MSRFPILALAAVAFFGTGCRHNCKDHRSFCERVRDRFDDRRDGQRRDTSTDREPVNPSGVIPPRGETIPPTPLPVTPRNSNAIDWDPNASLPAPKRSSEKILPSDLPRSVPSDPLLVVPPGPPNRTLLLPDPLLQDPLKTNPRDPTSGILGEPIQPDNVKLNEETKLIAPDSKTDLPTDAPAVGVESFAPVPGQNNVAGGKKPTVEGLDALKSKGFKTVLYLHAPDADMSAAKELVEKRGLKFVALAVSPQTLGDAGKIFAEQLKDAASKPLFVYDLDGVRAGSLWYLQFRKVDLVNDDVARIRAGALGLKDADTSEEQKQFWIAIQTQLAQR